MSYVVRDDSRLTTEQFHDHHRDIDRSGVAERMDERKILGPNQCVVALAVQLAATPARAITMRGANQVAPPGFLPA